METVYIDVLKDSDLFQKISEKDIPDMLGCLSATTRAYRKNEVIMAAGTTVSHVGVVLSGRAHIEQDDYWGNRTILAQVGPAELFGEAFSSAGVRRLPVNVYAAEDTLVLMVDYQKIATSCTSACAFHAQLIQNMLRILAQKNAALTQKMEIITQRTTRDKVLAYLSQQARQQAKDTFEIPFNRQELADYLSVDRSALSSELSKMQKEGILRYEKNRFALS